MPNMCLIVCLQLGISVKLEKKEQSKFGCMLTCWCSLLFCGVWLLI